MEYDALSDESLVVAISSSAQAFDVFYRRHVTAVMRFLAGRCRNADDVADATAATFAAVLDSCATFRSERGSAMGWLFTIAKNEARDLHRDHDRQVDLANRMRGRQLLSPDDTERVAEMIDAERAADLLAPMLEAARPGELELLERIVAEDETPAAASRALGIDPGAGRVRLSRLRNGVRIRAALASDHRPPTEDER